MKYLWTMAVIVVASSIPHFAHAVTLTNPLGITDPRLLVARLIQGALSLMGTIALLMFMYGGFLWLTSAGKPEPVKKG
ncbi:hypothetical protein KJ766_01605, partial [Patescibacteria group bacterium]|nr:hypothetical protein [Patescibacteria group bacterium]